MSVSGGTARSKDVDRRDCGNGHAARAGRGEEEKGLTAWYRSIELSRSDEENS